MKRLIGAIIVLVLITAGVYYVFVPQTHNPQKSPLIPTPTSQSQQNQPSFCTAKDLEATIEMGAAAGNIYGMITLKNISSTPCHMIGNNKITVVSSAKNITLNYYPISLQKDIVLSPNQRLYGKVHYPNGPQCQSSIINSTIAFSYQINPNTTVTFADSTGKSNQTIITCSGANNSTQVDIWNLSTQQQ